MRGRQESRYPQSGEFYIPIYQSSERISLYIVKKAKILNMMGGGGALDFSFSCMSLVESVIDKPIFVTRLLCQSLELCVIIGY